MARVTVEDCLKNVKNRFELVHIAAKRTRQLMHGKEPKVAWDNDKPTVVALREIAAGFTKFDEPEEQVIINIANTFPAADATIENEEDIEVDVVVTEENDKKQPSISHLERDEE